MNKKGITINNNIPLENYLENEEKILNEETETRKIIKEDLKKQKSYRKKFPIGHVRLGKRDWKKYKPSKGRSLTMAEINAEYNDQIIRSAESVIEKIIATLLSGQKLFKDDIAKIINEASPGSYKGRDLNPKDLDNPLFRMIQSELGQVIERELIGKKALYNLKSFALDKRSRELYDLYLVKSSVTISTLFPNMGFEEKAETEETKEVKGNGVEKPQGIIKKTKEKAELKDITTIQIPKDIKVKIDINIKFGFISDP